jgi:hypothetical protein
MRMTVAEREVRPVVSARVRVAARSRRAAVSQRLNEECGVRNEERGRGREGEGERGRPSPGGCAATLSQRALVSTHLCRFEGRQVVN